MTVAGDLNKRIRIDMPTKIANTRGELVPGWVPWTGVPGGKLWAQKFDLRGREFFAAAQAQSEITTRWRIRYRLGITPDMRVVFGGMFYDIKGIPLEADGRQWLDLMTKAGPTDGR